MCQHDGDQHTWNIRTIPADVQRTWEEGRGGVYALLDHTYAQLGGEYQTDPRILAVGPAAAATDFGAIASVPISKGRLSHVDTWAGRGGSARSCSRAITSQRSSSAAPLWMRISVTVTLPTIGSRTSTNRR